MDLRCVCQKTLDVGAEPCAECKRRLLGLTRGLNVALCTCKGQDSISTFVCGWCHETVEETNRPLELGPSGWWRCTYFSRRMQRDESLHGCTLEHARLAASPLGGILSLTFIKP